MKRCLLTFVLVCGPLTIQAQTVRQFYVSPSGSDANPGTAAQPWGTFQRAVDAANPGDVINVLPGTYRPVASRSSAVLITRSGTSAAPITLQGLGGRPVLDVSGIAWPQTVYGLDLQADWWRVKGIDVTGARQSRTDVRNHGIGIQLYNASHNVIENVRAYGNQGTGFHIGHGGVVNDNLLLNNDAYDNYDPLTAGEDADGFVFAGVAGSGGNVVDGCRSWHNSDDGFDLFGATSVWIIRNSWSWANGYGGAGDGNGFKLGPNDSGPRHKIYNNLAFNNLATGFLSNGASGPVELLNNTAYNNGDAGFIFGADSNGRAVAHYLRNNVSIGSPYHEATNTTGDQANNSWNLPVTANASDFLSVDANLAAAPRTPNGSLPANNLFRLVPTSDLIDKGLNVGLPYSGTAPDLGAFESSAARIGGQTELTVYRPTTGEWFVRFSGSSGSLTNWAGYQWGLPGDVPLVADFDGDHKTDLTVYRPGTGEWFVRLSSSNFSYANWISYQWGLPGDVPLAADFDADGKTDLTVYRPTTGEWFVRLSTSNYSYATWRSYQWGLQGDVPLVTDFDHDGRTELAVYRPSTGQWFVRLSSSNYSYTNWVSYQWGLPGDVPLVADVDADGKTDLTVYRPATGEWFVRVSTSNYSYANSVTYQLGGPGDVPHVGDFDGDGKSDLCVWRPGNGTWYVRSSASDYSNAAGVAYQWGLPGDTSL